MNREMDYFKILGIETKESHFSYYLQFDSLNILKLPFATPKGYCQALGPH